MSLDGFWQIGVWHHICLTYDGTVARLYADGVEVASAAKMWNLVPSRARIGRQVNDIAEFWDGMVDDVRVYDIALTPEQIQEVMRGDPLLAWDPQPKSGANVDIRSATSLNWSAGETAARHDVYFGADKNAVRAADLSSAEYMGRQSGTSFALKGSVEFGGGSYFWRVDEIEADDTTVHKGLIWGFTVPDYLIVDEFEDYTDDEGNRIYEAWIDGWTNGSGSQVGYLQAPFAERAVIHGGRQSMPLDYNNTKTPFYSEAERTWESPQDWTTHGVDTLRLYFAGGLTNTGDTLYIVLEDSAGHEAAAVRTNPADLLVPTWQDWSIPLSDLAAGGVNLAGVKRMYIGVGNRTAPTRGGSGRLYIDDIRVTRP